MSSSLSCVSGNACASRTARYSLILGLGERLVAVARRVLLQFGEDVPVCDVLLEGDRVVRDCRQAVIEVPIPGHDVVKRFEEVEEGELEFFTEVLRSVLCEI